MFGKYFLAFCALALFAVAVNAAQIPPKDVIQDLEEIDAESVETRGVIDTIIEYLQDFLVEASKNCLKEIAHECKKIWYNPKKLLKCAKKYFHEHKGECAIPDA